MVISYNGGKTKLGKQIYNIIKKYDDEENPLPYFEPFCGMCGVLIHFSKENSNRKIYANDINKDIILLWKAIQKGWKPPTTCSRNTYDLLKFSNKNSPERGFIGITASFSGMFFEGGFRTKTSTYDFVKSGSKKLLETKDYIDKVKFQNKSYDTYNPKGFLIYCDPPYINNNVANYTFKNFNHNNFWKIMRKWSKNNIVIISEKEAPDDFICIWEKEYKVSFLNSQKITNNKKKYTEKLFIHKSLY